MGFEEALPRHFRRDYGTGGQDGRYLISHAGSTSLLEHLSYGGEGTGVEAELDDVDDVFDVDLLHVGLDTELGCSRVYWHGALARVNHDDFVVLAKELVDEEADAVNNGLLRYAIEEAYEVMVEEEQLSVACFWLVVGCE